MNTKMEETKKEEQVVETPQVEETAQELERKVAEAEAKRLELLRAKLTKIENENKELEEVEQYKYPEPKGPVVNLSSDLELIKAKFAKVDEAIMNNLPMNHPERQLPNTTFNGVSILDGYYRYTKGEKIEEIFKNPLE